MPRIFMNGLICWLALICGAAHELSAEQIEGVQFRDTCQIGKTKLILHNVALMRYQVVIKAMVAGLYLGEGVEPQDALSDVPKRLEIHYFWALAGRDIVSASEKLLGQNLSAAKIKAIRPQIDQMNALYQDIKAGDRYALTYLPGKGTELTLNGNRKGVVPGADFAAAYFTIWLGEHPMDTTMKTALLKQK